MAEYAPVRTLLFIPGNRPERVDKAVNAGADVVIIDLEDAVPVALKEETRPLVRKKVIQYKKQNIIVRVNALDSGFLKGDLDEIVIEAFEEAEAKGLAAIQLNGKMIDYPVVERSKRIVRLAERIGSK